MTDKIEVKTTSAIKDKLGLTKKKVLLSLLVAFSLPFVLFISSTLSVFFNNAEELGFSIGDFAPFFLSVSGIAFVLIFAALLLTKGWLHNLVFALCSALTISAFAETFITTLTFTGLPGDGNTLPTPTWQVVADLGMWVVIFAAAIWFAVIWKKSHVGRKITSFLLVLVLVMQSVSLVPSAITFASNHSEDKGQKMYLTTENMFEVSSNKNVIVFVLDRFDRNYFIELAENSTDTLSALDGFTYYDDNISMYPRTYPATTSMLTGIENDYTTPRSDYFETAYNSGTFLQDLRDNNYKVNLYIPYYYSYTDASVLNGIAANISPVEGHSISSQRDFIENMIKLSSYFWLPEKVKFKTVSSNSFYECVTLEGSAPEYSMSSSGDSKVYAEFAESGLSTQDEQNTFTFLHLRGCHSPFNTDENGIYLGDNTVTSLQQTQGCFKFITDYIAELKAAGLYEDATIIITGDHAALRSDYELYTEPKLTALLVKESGKAGTKLSTSNAQVSQSNLLATIVRSEELKTNTDYGKAYSEVSEDETVVRTHYFQKLNGMGRNDTNVIYEIKGDGADFSSWQIPETKEIENK